MLVNGSLSASLTTSTNKYNNRYFLKLADDTVIVSLLENNEICHGPVVDDFVKWCDDPCLQLNVCKTRH